MTLRTPRPLMSQTPLNLSMSCMEKRMQSLTSSVKKEFTSPKKSITRQPRGTTPCISAPTAMMDSTKIVM